MKKRSEQKALELRYLMFLSQCVDGLFSSCFSSSVVFHRVL